MKNLFFTGLALLCLVFGAEAQKDSVLMKLEDVYQNIDMSQVPSCILFDKGYGFVNPDRYQHPDLDSVQTVPGAVLPPTALRKMG